VSNSAGDITVHRPRHDDDEDTAKLIFGIVYSLRNFTRKLADEDSFMSYSTSRYRLHYYETPSNIKFVLLTDPKAEGLHVALSEIYATLYIEYIVKK
jgi:hypothetical protein